MSITKSKARKLAEFLRNITEEAKLTTEAVQNDKVVTTGTALDDRATDTTALVSAASVTSYVGDKLDDYVHNTHDINLTFTGDVTGHGTITDMGHTSFNLTLDAETLPVQTGYAGKFLTTDGTTASWATVDTSKGDTAYSWGDHSTVGYLTSFTETDPTVPSHVKSITTTDVSQWDAAYSWGDHSQEGYLTSETNDYLDSATFSGGTLTLGRTGSLSDVTVNLDGRYSQTDTNTTYSVSAADVASGKAIRLTGSNSVTDDVILAGGSNVSLTRSGDTITINSADAAAETITTLTKVGNDLKYVNEAGTTATIDLTSYLDDTNLSKILSGTMSSSGIATFSRDDNSTFTVDMSVLLDDTNLARIVSAGWNTGNGVLTLTRNDGSTIPVDLDNRYLQTENDTLASVTARGNSTNQDIIISKTSAKLRLHEPNTSDQNFPSLEFDTDNNQGIALSFNEFDNQVPIGGYGIVVGPSSTNTQFPTVGAITFNVLGEIYAGGTTLGSLSKVWHAGNFNPSSYLLTSNYQDNYADSVSFNTSNGILTISRTGALADLTVDLDGRYLTSETDSQTLSWNGSTGQLSISNGNTVDLDNRYFTESESDSRYVNVTGDTMTGALTLSGATDLNFLAGSNEDAGDIVWKYYNGTEKHRLWDGGTGLNYRYNAGTAYKLFHDGYHPNADKWTTARTITLSGDLNGSVSLDGSSNVTLSAQVVNDSHTHDTRYVQQGGTSFSGEYPVVVRVSDRNFYSDGNIRFQGSDSKLTVDGRVDAPIFYDSNNTAYYTDPASQSVMAKLKLTHVDDAQLILDGSSTSWSGIGFQDANSPATDFIWHYGATRTFALGGGGAPVAGKKLHVHGGTTIGENLVGTTAPTNGLKVEGDVEDNLGNQMITARHSGSDFVNGTLVQTNIPATGASGASYVIEVTGKSYSGEPPFAFKAQGYLYSNTIINHSGINYGDLRLTYIKAMEYNGYLCFWWPRISYWNSFQVHVRDAGGGSQNRVTTIGNASEPSVSKKVQTNLRMSVSYDTQTNAGNLYATAYYDSNDNAYVVDPAGTSYVNDLRANIVYDRNNTAYYFGSSSGDYRFRNGTVDNLTVNGTTTLGNGNGDKTKINDILELYATDSGDSHFYFGEDSSGGYGSYWYWDSSYTHYWYSRHAGTNSTIMYHSTSDTTYLHMGRHLHLHNKDINYVNQLHFNDNVRFYDDGNDNYLNYKWGDGGSGGIKFYDGNTTLHGYIYGDGGGRFGLLDNDGQWAVRVQTGTDPLELRCNDNVEFQVFDSYTLSPGSSRAPIFYDSNDTSYYCDPTSTSFVKYLGRRSHNTGHLVGSYNSVGGNSAKTNPIYTIGSSYNPNDADLNNMYGIGYSHSNASFISGNGFSGWGMYVSSAGTARVYLSGESGHVAGTGNTYFETYYDRNNTGYYVDPASTSNMLLIQMPHRGNGTSNIIVNNGGSENWRAIDVDGGSNNHGIGTSGTSRSVFGRNALCFHTSSSDSIRFHSDGWDTTFEVTGAAGNAWVKGDIRVPIYYDKDNTSYYWNPNVSGAHRLQTPSGYLDVGPMNATYCHFQTDRGEFYFNKTVRFDGAGARSYDAYAAANFPIYYDYVNTAYYTDSASESVMAKIKVKENTSTAGYTYMTFKNYIDTQYGSIYRSYGTMVYGTSSDYRLKENVISLSNASDRLNQLQPKRFNFIEYSDVTVDGFIAHEVAEVVPEAVVGEKDAVDHHGKPIHQSVDHSKLVPLLTASLQEALAKIEDLETRLSLLEQ